MKQSEKSQILRMMGKYREAFRKRLEDSYTVSLELERVKYYEGCVYATTVIMQAFARGEFYDNI